MDIISIIIISLIEGITEFLPISSTGHLIVVADFLNLEQTEKLKAFETMIQFFAVLAILFLFRRKINIKSISLWKKTTIAFLPIGILGFIFSDQIKNLFDLEIVAWAFIVGGIIFLFSEKIFEKNKKKNDESVEKVEDISFLDSLKIGLFQIFALIPGTSRSGATILGAMYLGINRKISAEFSFLLAVPVTFAVFAFDFFSFFKIFTKEDFYFLFLAAIISFISSYFSVKLLLKFLEKFSFFAFGVYRIIFGIILLVFFI